MSSLTAAEQPREGGRVLSPQTEADDGNGALRSVVRRFLVGEENTQEVTPGTEN